MCECLVCECIYTCINTLRVHLGMASFSLIQNLTKLNYICTCNEWLLQLMAIVFTHSPHTVQADLEFLAHILFHHPLTPLQFTNNGCVWYHSVNLTLCWMSRKALEIQSVVSTPRPICPTHPAGQTCWESTG